MADPVVLTFTLPPTEPPIVYEMVPIEAITTQSDHVGEILLEDVRLGEIRHTPLEATIRTPWFEGEVLDDQG